MTEAAWVSDLVRPPRGSAHALALSVARSRSSRHGGRGRAGGRTAAAGPGRAGRRGRPPRRSRRVLCPGGAHVVDVRAAARREADECADAGAPRAGLALRRQLRRTLPAGLRAGATPRRILVPP